jgi:hypothetical protein
MAGSCELSRLDSQDPSTSLRSRVHPRPTSRASLGAGQVQRRGARLQSLVKFFTSAVDGDIRL